MKTIKYENKNSNEFTKNELVDLLVLTSLLINDGKIDEEFELKNSEITTEKENDKIIKKETVYNFYNEYKNIYFTYIIVIENDEFTKVIENYLYE